MNVWFIVATVPQERFHTEHLVKFFFLTQKEPTHEQTVIINVGGLAVPQVRQSCCREVSLKGKQRSGTKVCGTHEWDHARTTQQGAEECEVRWKWAHFTAKIWPQDHGLVSIVKVVIFIDYRLLLLCVSIAILASEVHAVSFLSHLLIFACLGARLQTAACFESTYKNQTR